MANVNVFAQLKDSLPPLIPTQDPTLPTWVFAPTQADAPAQLAPVGKSPAPPKVFASATPSDPAATAPTAKAAPSKVFAPTAPDDTETAIHGHINQKLLADYKKDADPYGSPDNHPGKWGETLHVLSKIGNTVGNIFVPHLMADIPGTDLNRSMQEQGLEGRAEGLANDQSKQRLEGAQAGNQTAEAGKNIADTTGQNLTNLNEPQRAADAHAASIAGTANVQSETNLRDHPRPDYKPTDTDEGNAVQQSFDANTKTSPKEPLLETGLKSVVGGAASPFVHPINTVRSMSHLLDPFGPGSQNPVQGMIDSSRQDYKDGGLAITNMAEQGVPVHVIMAFAGHICQKMQQHYVAVSHEAKRHVSEAMPTIEPPPQPVLRYAPHYIETGNPSLAQKAGAR